jgi:hypothetical protein
MSRASSVPVLVTLMLITGVCNTLLTKYQVRSYNYGTVDKSRTTH